MRYLLDTDFVIDHLTGQAEALIVPVLPFSRSIAKRTAKLRLELRQQGRSVNNRALDLIIAATALEHDLTLVTRNRKDYDDIAVLRLN